MSVITETEIKSMTKEQNYMQGYKDGKNDVLDKIRAEIAQKIVIRPALNHSRTERDRNDAFLEVLEIIDKYRKEQEDNGFFDEIMDDESENEETYEKIKEIINEVKEQEE